MLSPYYLPLRKPAVSIEELARAKAEEVVIHAQGISSTDAPKSLAFTARLIEGHPDDIDGLRSALKEPRVRAALLADLERDDENLYSEEVDDLEPIIGRASVKVLSAIYAAEAQDFDGYLVLAFKPLSTHLDIFRGAQSAHAKMQIHALDPDLGAILARPWQAPFHGHAHHWSRLSWRLRRLLGLI